MSTSFMLSLHHFWFRFVFFFGLFNLVCACMMFDEWNELSNPRCNAISSAAFGFVFKLLFFNKSKLFLKTIQAFFLPVSFDWEWGECDLRYFFHYSLFLFFSKIRPSPYKVQWPAHWIRKIAPWKWISSPRLVCQTRRALCSEYECERRARNSNTHKLEINTFWCVCSCLSDDLFVIVR